MLVKALGGKRTSQPQTFPGHFTQGSWGPISTQQLFGQSAILHGDFHRQAVSAIRAIRPGPSQGSRGSRRPWRRKRRGAAEDQATRTEAAIADGGCSNGGQEVPWQMHIQEPRPSQIRN